MTKKEMELYLASMFEIEIKSVKDVLKDAKKEPKEQQEHYKIMALSYIKGLQRAQELIAVVMQDVKNEPN